MLLVGHHCEARAKTNLNVQQFEVLARQDAAKAAWSAKRLGRYRRQLALHDAACVNCGGCP